MTSKNPEQSNHPTPNTQYSTFNTQHSILMNPEPSNKTLADYAISYKMSVAAFNPTATVKEVRAAAAKEFGCRESQTTGTVYLVLKEFTQPLTERVRRIRNFFDTNTIKLGDIDIIPSMNFWRVSEFVRDEIPEFDKAADDFVRRWESEIKPKSIEELKRLGVVLQNKGVKAWRMPVSEVADRIYFNFTKTPIGDTRTLSNLQGLTDDLRQSFEEELLAQQEDISLRANEELNKRLQKVLQDFVKKMKGYKGQGQRIHDSVVGNIGELVQLIPSMIVGEDDAIVELAQEAQLLTNWDVDILKESEPARKEAVNSAESILSKMRF